MGGNKKSSGLKRPLIYHSSIPAHIRSIAQNITGVKATGKNVSAGPSMDQSVGFIAENPTKLARKSTSSGKKSWKAATENDGRKKSPAKHSQASSAAPVVATRRPTSLQTNASSGYESEYQSSEVGSSWDWTAAEIIWKWQNNNLKTKKVYTDWANHYLDKAKCKKHIQDLQVDVVDGVVLADIIEAVTNQKIMDINKKPKTSMQMIENIKICLAFLANIGVNLDGITAKDVREGNLKAILGLFFSLSRHKQKQKQQHQITAEKEKLQRLQQEQKQQALQQEEMPQSRLPSPYKHGVSGTSIPMPSSTLARRGGLDKGRLSGALSGGNPHQSSNVYKCTSASSSRSSSPSNGGQIVSIPRPTTARNSLIEKQNESIGLKQPTLSGSRTSLRVPLASPYKQSQVSVPKNSLLEKFKLFKEKDSKIEIENPKRTSSSSGFSSAKSEHSDSSTSLCSDAKQTGSVEEKLESGVPVNNNPSTDNNSKLRCTRTKLIKSNCEKKQGSPKLKRMIETEPRNNVKQIVKMDKSKKNVESEKKLGHCAEESHSQDKLNVTVCEKEAEQKIDAVNKSEIPQPCSETTFKAIGSTGIPKPMAAVKGTYKTFNSTEVNPIKSRSPSVPKIRTETEKQKRDDVCIALVSPMRTSVDEGIKEIQEQKRLIQEPEKKLKDVEEEEMMNVKPMSPLLNGYRLGSHSGLHFTHPGYLNKIQEPKNVYYSQMKVNPNLVNLESIDLAMNNEMLKNMNRVNLMQNSNSGYVSDNVHTKRKDERTVLNDSPGSKINARCIEKTPETQSQHSLHKEKISTAVELSSDKNYLDETKGLVGSSPNQWPSQGDFHQSSVTYRSGISRSSGRKSDICQQTDGSAFRLVQTTQWKKYPPDEPTKLEDQRTKDRKSPISSAAGRKSKSSKGMIVKEDSGVKQNGSEGKVKVKGVPSSFGYVKRSTANGTTIATKSEAKTAQVSAVPRTKVKVSGGTQTTSDLTHFKSYSLTGASANQLSQCVRERLLGSQSLPKPGSSDYAALFHQHRQARQNKQPTDGSLSDTTYATYSELHSFYSNNSPYSSWMRNSSMYTASLPSRTSTGLVNAESLESLSSLPSQLQHRASLTHARLLLNQRESSSPPSHRLNRSNSIRSTKSEKLYPSMLQRSEEIDPYYGIPINSTPSKHNHASQPTSPTPSQISQGVPSRFNFPLSPITSSTSNHGLNRGNLSVYTPVNGSKTSTNDDDVHGSSLSLVSTASSLYSTAEEKQAHEIRKLRKELMDSQEKVYTLTSQLSTNAHVVSAFEKSLSSMTQRLQNLMATTEKKDQELLELRKNIELLRKQGKEMQNGTTNASGTASQSTKHQNNSEDMIIDGNTTITRQLSTDSVSSLNSLSSTCSISSSANCSSNKTKKKKKSWLRSSFSKAFSRSRKNKNGSVSDVEDFRRLQTNGDIINNTDVSAPSSPLLNNHVLNANSSTLKVSHSSSALYKPNIQSEETSECDLVEDLKKQLREKDLVLTDIRLEALSSAHQLESLKDTVIKMRNELLNLKQDNERLQRIVTSKSLTSSQNSINHLGGNTDKRFSINEQISLSSQSNSIIQDGEGGKRVLVSVFLSPNGVFHKYLEDSLKSETAIAAIHISQKTQWETLDNLVRKTFKEYVLKLDPSSGLGLNRESIWSYQVGEIIRFKDSPTPDFLPYTLLTEEKNVLRVCLKGAAHNGSLDALAFETLIPKSIIQRYISLLSEHRRIILCGPSGTGKSYLANKLSEFLVLRTGKESTSGSIATFNVDHKNSKELRQYLTNVAEQCENNASDLPSVIILDNLHQASSLAEVFNGFLSSKYSKCPFIIGTMNQATCSTTNLQLHHNFRWILCANHMEPVKGFLSRYLRRRTLDSELRDGTHNNDFARIIDWIPKVWHHLNKFIEMHTSSDVTIGPRLFLLCPGTVEESRIWFTDLWNYAIVPYLMDAVREGLQLYGKRTAWEDPTQFVIDTYPWTDETTSSGQEALLRVRPEDVGFDVNGSSDGGKATIKAAPNQSESEGDPLLNMLLRLQEVANYTRSHVNANDVPDSRHTTEVIPEIMETSKTSESCI